MGIATFITHSGRPLFQNLSQGVDITRRERVGLTPRGRGGDHARMTKRKTEPGMRAHRAVARSIVRPALGASLVTGAAAGVLALASGAGCGPEIGPPPGPMPGVQPPHLLETPPPGVTAPPVAPPGRVTLAIGVHPDGGVPGATGTPGLAPTRAHRPVAPPARPTRSARRATDPDARALYAAFVGSGRRALA
jgi:hypothetical protein